VTLPDSKHHTDFHTSFQGSVVWQYCQSPYILWYGWCSCKPV